jgi:xylan 1,4-beta-xylosidase
VKKILLSPDWVSPPTPFKHTWEGLINVDQFRWFVRADMQDQLRMAHQELGARHVRAVGILDDEMRVLTADPTRWRQEGKTHPEPNWQIVTMIFERLLGLGIYPMITTCFMPGVMAAGERTVFETKARISQPKDMDHWRELVGNLTRHLVGHFGLEVIRNCYFEVWNEPNLTNGFFEGGQEDFFNLYLHTASAIKEVDAGFKIGGPSTARAEWIPEFLEFARKHQIEPDYLIGHIYNNDSDSKPLSPFDGPQEDLVSKSPHFASGVIRGVRKFLDEAGYTGEVHWNEWGRSWFPCEPQRETVNEAAFIAKTMAEVSQLGDYFAYWNLSDIYDQVGYGRQTFHGNYGLLNLQGLRKPSYQAFQLLSLLGTGRVEVAGSGLDKTTHAIATHSAESSEVLVYAYDETNAEVGGCAEITVTLPPGRQPRKLYRITENENNILADWKALGSPCYLNTATRQTLEQKNLLTGRTDFAQSGQEVTFTMETPGVALLTFS